MFSAIVDELEIGRKEDEPRERVHSRVIEIVLFPVITKNRRVEGRREGTILREIVDVALSGWIIPGVVIPREDGDVREVSVEFCAPSVFRRVVRVSGEPTVAQVADGQGEVRARRVQDAQGFSKASPSAKVARDGELESVRIGPRRGHGEPSAYGDEHRHEHDAPCSPRTPQRRPPPALLASLDSISAFRATLSTRAHTAASLDHRNRARTSLGTGTVRTRDSALRKRRYAFVVKTDGLDSSPMCGVTWLTKTR